MGIPFRVGHSPDPDDAFLFYGLTQGKVELGDLTVTHIMEGIEQLNERALTGELEMTAISLHAYPYCAQRYLLLPTGASVGDRVGPIVVSKRPMSVEQLKGVTVAVPGRMTTAALLLQLAVGNVRQEVFPFDHILAAVYEGKVEAGVLIHEGQLTYNRWKLEKVLDLGEWWWQKTQFPVPLGVNVIRRDLGPAVIRQMDAAFRASLDYAMTHRPEAIAYALRYARGLDQPTTDRFVDMYVNRWSVECRPQASAAMQRLLDWAAQGKLIPRRVPIEFVES